MQDTSWMMDAMLENCRTTYVSEGDDTRRMYKWMSLLAISFLQIAKQFESVCAPFIETYARPLIDDSAPAEIEGHPSSLSEIEQAATELAMQISATDFKTIECEFHKNDDGEDKVEIYTVLIPHRFVPNQTDKYFRKCRKKTSFHCLAKGKEVSLIAAMQKQTDDTLQSVVIKRYDAALFKNHASLHSELRILRFLNHSKIAAFYGAYCEPRSDSSSEHSFCIVQERLQMPLHKLLRDENPNFLRTPKYVVRLLHQILDALNYMHSHGIYHRAISPRVIGVNDARFCAKIIDFSYAQIALDPYETQGFDLAFMSPQEIQGVNEKEKADVYALGAVALAMLGISLNDGKSENSALIKQIEDKISELSKEHPQALKSWSKNEQEAFVKLELGMLNLSSEERLTAAQCLESKFLEQTNKLPADRLDLLRKAQHEKLSHSSLYGEFKFTIKLS